VPLPLAAPEQSSKLRVLAAVLVALIAAVVGFFGVRFIADVATDGASSPSSISQPATPGDDPPAAG
jgi:hypothetical protein